MKRKLKEELNKLSTDIITTTGSLEIPELYERAKALYEKLAVLKFIEEKLDDIEIDVSKNVVAAKFEKLANAVMTENKSVPESNPHEEDIITPGMHTIKQMVSEMPETDLEKIFGDFLAKPTVMKNDMETVTPEIPDEKPTSLNDKLTKEISVGLNDRLAFVKHLFNDKTEDYNRVMSQLETTDSYDRSVTFINDMIKPEYNNWEGKEEYEKRFMALIERKFL